MIEILLTLYEVIMKKNDKFILSKAHASFPLCILLKQKGLNPKLTTHLELDKKNGIHCTTGSLGHGLPIATGMAFAKKAANLNPGGATGFGVRLLNNLIKEYYEINNDWKNLIYYKTRCRRKKFGRKNKIILRKK